ncbi:MAG: hypothetical protein NTU81_02990 [Candidatus Nomurabacteria bacterium]|nr:hypothetical protein [Candidatus Nomurabacteria bacterium]
MKKRQIAFSVMFTLVWYFLSEYLFMPAISFDSTTGIYWNLIVYLTVMAIIFFNIDSNKKSDFGKALCIVLGISAIILLLGLGIGGFFSTSTWMNTEKYRGMIGNIKETEFTANVQPIAVNQMLIVDEEIAKRVGEKVLGSDPGLGSRSEIGDYTLQAVNGQLYWIAPLLHSGFWKWNSFGDEGTPGYVRVSATNQEDYALVTNVKGKKLHIVYQPEAYFSQDLERHIYTNGYRSILFSDFTFEVDDNWNPYWTVTVQKTKIGFSGNDAVGVLVVDPQTGDVRQYKTEEAPAWIDRIQPKDFVSEQVDDWGNYIHGYWNWSGKDKIRVAEESSLVLGNDGRSYFYFGLTSEGKDESTVGFVMVDTRTKKAHWFKQAGATEKAARVSAEGKVQEKGFVGSDGVTYNIDGHPTYEFLLKDKGGLMKLVALVNVHDHTLVGIGENRQQAIRDYRNQMTSRGNTVSLVTSDMESTVLVSKILRIASLISKGETYYQFILVKEPKTIFTAGTEISDELSLTKEGDVIKIYYVKLNSESSVSISKFDNIELMIGSDSIQIKNEERLDTIKAKVIQQKSEEVVDNKINNLSSVEKKKLLKLIKQK